MFNAVLSPADERIFGILSRLDFMRSFYLAGGTGCALQIGHRRSHDFDFFSRTEFEIFSVQNALRNLGRFVADYTDAGTLVGRLENSKISLFHYAYPLLEEGADYLGIRVASLVDIGCMKIDAISSRGTKRDFIDLFFIQEKLGLDLKALFGYFEKKFGPDGFNRHHILKSLVYFEEADKEPDPDMLADFSWSAVKQFFIKNIGGFPVI